MWRSSRLAVRSASDNVSTTPLQVMIHVDTIAVTTKTATGTVTVTGSVKVAATATALTSAHKYLREPAEQLYDHGAALEVRDQREEVAGEPGDERPADAHRQGEHGGGDDRPHRLALRIRRCKGRSLRLLRDGGALTPCVGIALLTNSVGGGAARHLGFIDAVALQAQDPALEEARRRATLHEGAGRVATVPG